MTPREFYALPHGTMLLWRDGQTGIVDRSELNSGLIRWDDGVVTRFSKTDESWLSNVFLCVEADPTGFCDLPFFYWQLLESILTGPNFAWLHVELHNALKLGCRS